MNKFHFTFFTFLIPTFVAAAPGDRLDTLIGTIKTIIGNLIPIVSALAVLYFFWGLAKYILSAGDEKKAEEGRSIMIWGTIALFVMLSIYGIVGFIQNTLGVGGGNQNVVNSLVFPTIQ